MDINQTVCFLVNKIRAFSIFLLICLLGCELEEIDLPNPSNSPTPIACFNVDANECVVSCAINFDAGCSQNAVNYKWDFDNDGVPEIVGADLDVVQYTYTTAGTKNPRLVVQNLEGDTSVISKTLTVNDESYNLEIIDWNESQEGIVGDEYNLKVRLTNQNNDPVPNTTVVFDVISGGGFTNNSTDLTDNNGIALTTWTLGDSFVIQEAISIVNANDLIAGPESFRINVSKFRDKRDNKIYKAVTIGDQIWMAENLNYDSLDISTKCPNGVNENCDIYGRLYFWPHLMNGDIPNNNTPSEARGLCPSGWHIPSKAEFEILVNSYGGVNEAGGELKSESFWIAPNTGANNNSGFTALPSGIWVSPIGQAGYYDFGTKAYYFTSTAGQDNGYYYNISLDNESTFVYINEEYVWHFYSCRCVKDD